MSDDRNTSREGAQAKETTMNGRGDEDIFEGLGIKHRRRLKVGDRVSIVGDHPWAQHSGRLIAYEKYGLGWMGWRVELDGNCGECYASAQHLTGGRT